MATYTSGPKQAPRTSLVPSGEYLLEVLNAEDGVSEKSGNDKIELKFEVVLPDGEPGPIVYDTLVFVANAAWKIDQFRAAIGEEVVEGEEVEVNPDDFIGKRLRARLTQERDRTDKTKKRNRIGSYLERKPGEESDDIPF
jgi:hypothetical protein